MAAADTIHTKKKSLNYNLNLKIVEPYV